MRGYLCAAKILLKDFAQHTQQISQQIGDLVRQTAADEKRPYRYLRSASLSKEDWIEQTAQHDHIRQGLIAVLGAVEPCLVMTVRPNHQTQRWNRFANKESVRIFTIIMRIPSSVANDN